MDIKVLFFSSQKMKSNKQANSQTGKQQYCTSGLIEDASRKLDWVLGKQNILETLAQ